MRDVLQSTARKFKIYMADSSSPMAGKTGLSSFTVYLSKDNTAEATVSPTVTERGHGWYEVTPTTAHRDTLGENAWTFTATGAVDFPHRETVVLYDAQVAAVGANTIAPATPTNVSDAGWTSTEKSQMRHRLGIDGTANTPSASPSLAEPGDLMGLLPATIDDIVDVLLNFDLDSVIFALSSVGSHIQGAKEYSETTVGKLAGITVLADWLRRMARKDAGTAGMIAAEAEIDTGGTSTFSGATDSLEAISDASGGGGGGGDATLANQTLMLADLAELQLSLSGTAIDPTGRVSSGGDILLYVGDDCTQDSDTLLEIPVADVGGAMLAKLTAIGVANLTFGASRANKAASLISGTVVSLDASGSGATLRCIISVEIIAAGTAAGCTVADDYEYQISQRQNTSDDFVEISGALDLRARRVAIP